MRTWPRLGPTALAAEETLSPPATRLIASSFGAIGLERYWALSGSWRGSALIHLDIVPLSGYPSCAVNSAIENSPQVANQRSSASRFLFGGYIGLLSGHASVQFGVRTP